MLYHKLNSPLYNNLGILVLLFFLVNPFCSAQDTTYLKEIPVIAIKNEFAAIGKKVQTIDSTTKKLFIQSNLGDLLAANTPIHIKNYGNGAISTTSFRGGSANQTAILWNGFNLKNAMLGHIDLSLLPANLFNDVSIEYGGGSSTWGSDAVGGSVHLKTGTALKNNGWKVIANPNWASFGNFNTNLCAELKHKKFSSRSYFYSNANQNNFKYKDTLNKENPIQTATNAFYAHNGILQTVSYQFNNSNQINVNAWYHKTDRRLPNFFTSQESKRYQFDKSLRLTTNYNYTKRRYFLIFKNAFFNDKLNYNDSAIALYSKSSVNTFISELENFYQYHPKNQLQVGLNFTENKATASNYSEQQNKLTRFAMNLANKTNLLNSNLIIYTSLRVEKINFSSTPITGNVSANYKICNWLKAKVNFAKVYRQPTLNELFWQPGGNPNINPEQGYSQEGDLEFDKQFNKIKVTISGSIYNRNIMNWILWTPGASGNPSPINLQEVWSRGTESVWKLSYHKTNYNFGLTLNTGYCLSTIEKDLQENNSTLNRQLIYTPRYTINSNLFFHSDYFSLMVFHHYVGYRFTTSDNLNWLNPYHLLSARLATNFNKEKDFVNLFLAVNNLLNNNYVIVANKPMPLRNFEIGITIHFKRIKT